MAHAHIVIICGEASGDLHAAFLAKKLLELNPQVKISGVGGPALRGTGAEIFYDIKDLSVMGFFDALKKLPKFFALQKIVLDTLKREKPNAIVLVDFSGFNLRLAKRINKALPVIYYISPQVWASRQGRIKTIKKYVHKIIVFFKFEEEFYKKFGLDNVDFVGHPLLDIVKPTMEKTKLVDIFGLSPSKTTIALLPGSRRQEIENILPLMLGASTLIAKKIKNTQFVLAKPPQISSDIYQYFLNRFDIEVKIIEGRTYDCLSVADYAFVCSGTATLETAIMQKPFAVVYKMRLLNYLLYRPQIRIPHIGMVNIVAGKKIVPEFIQFGARPEQLAQEALRILQDSSEAKRMQKALGEVISALGERNASTRAAQVILDFLKGPFTQP